MYQPIETMPKGVPCFVRQDFVGKPNMGRISVCKRVGKSIQSADGSEISLDGGKLYPPHEWAHCQSKARLEMAGWL